VTDDVTSEAGIGPDLVRWGRAARLETTGRRSGRSVAVHVSFHEEADGSLLVAAGSPDAAWAANLAADPAVRVTIADRTFAAVAEPLAGADFAKAIRELILKGGTPAEQLGHGPAFRLRRVVRGA
jgi:deazaflavin-dependent oxidoreductase (nitroreductase family)